MTIVIGAETHKTDGQWLSPATGGRERAQLWFEDGRVYAQSASGERRSVLIAKAECSERMPGVPRRITFDDGIIVVVDDDDFVDAAMGKRGLLPRMESQWRGIIGFVAAAALAVWVMIVYALPVATSFIAARVSQDTLQSLTAEVYAQLQDNAFIAESKLPPPARARAEAVFLRVVKTGGGDDGFRYQLRFHRMQFNAANAFAFPDGMIIASDGLITLLGDKELAAVFAHEISHVRRRHGLRFLMESSLVFLLSSFVFGDISFVLSGGAALLVQQKLSREFEREADCDAYRYLRERGESEAIMVSALTKLENQLEAMFDNALADGGMSDAAPKPKVAANGNDTTEESEDGAAARAVHWVFDLLSTHPATHERADFRDHCHD